MRNERLNAAVRASGMKIEDIAVRVGVDPKTADRWITMGRVPHPNTRRQVVKLLRVAEDHLWPPRAKDVRKPHEAVNELVHLYPTRSSVPYDVWMEMIKGVTANLDVLVFSGQFLVEQFELLPTIRTKAPEGVRFRLAVGDYTSPAVIQRAQEEGTTGGLEGRVQMMARYLETVAHLDGVDVRTHGTILYNSIYRFDDDLFVNGHAFGSLAGQNPLWHLRRVDGGQMWEHYMQSFERVWELAQPVGATKEAEPSGTGGLLR